MRSFKKPGKGHSGSQRNGFSKCAAFQFLEILQDLTKVYSSCLEEEADQLLFFSFPSSGKLVGVAHRVDSVICVVNEMKT